MGERVRIAGRGGQPEAPLTLRIDLRNNTTQDVGKIVAMAFLDGCIAIRESHFKTLATILKGASKSFLARPLEWSCEGPLLQGSLGFSDREWRMHGAREPSWFSFSLIFIPIPLPTIHSYIPLPNEKKKKIGVRSRP
jgi:hypothetical protein